MGNEGWKTLFLSLRLPTVRKMLLTKMLIETRDSWSHCRWWCKPEHGYLKPEAGKQPSIMPRFMVKPRKQGNWIKKRRQHICCLCSFWQLVWEWNGAVVRKAWHSLQWRRESTGVYSSLPENKFACLWSAGGKSLWSSFTCLHYIKKGMMLVCSLRQEFVFNYTL